MNWTKYKPDCLGIQTVNGSIRCSMTAFTSINSITNWPLFLFFHHTDLLYQPMTVIEIMCVFTWQPNKVTWLIIKLCSHCHLLFLVFSLWIFSKHAKSLTLCMNNLSFFFVCKKRKQNHPCISFDCFRSKVQVVQKNLLNIFNLHKFHFINPLWA